VKSKKSECIPSENLETALHELKKAGLKVTPTRKMVLLHLTNAHGPFSIEEIHAGIKGKSCNLTTIYRIISHLEAIGLVRRTDLGDGVARYEYHCAEHPHHHLICRECKRIEIIDRDLFPEIEEVAKSKGFVQINPCFEIYGVCKNCAA